MNKHGFTLNGVRMSWMYLILGVSGLVAGLAALIAAVLLIALSGGGL